MTRPDKDFSAAVRHHQAGNLQQAETIYRRILRRDARHADALHMLGVIAHQRGQHETATEYIGKAIAVNAADPAYHSNLGAVHHARGHLDQAEARYREALRLNPAYAEAHNNLGMLLQDQGHSAEALAQYREALRLKPDYAEAHCNLGSVFQARGDLDEASGHYREALRLRADYPEAYSSLGTVSQDQGRLDEAMEYYRKALQIDAGCAGARSNRALLLLLTGDFEHGWPAYEWRRRESAQPEFSQPRWDGSPLVGQTILLYAEQGLGDTLQFIRYAPLVKRRGGTVVVQCRPSLARILATCPGIDVLLPHETPLPHFDVQASLLSLPGIFCTNLDSIPTPIPYLQPPHDLCPSFDVALTSSVGVLRVGLVWSGNPRHKNDRNRSCSLSHFRPLARVCNVALFSLQKGAAAADLQSEGDDLAATDLSPLLGDFADTAAAISRLDLVITVDTAVAHLAGALGKPVWVLLPFAPDWRWLLDREDSPWYPTMRLFRQVHPGDWAGVFERVTAALEEAATSRDVAHVTSQRSRGVPAREPGRTATPRERQPMPPSPSPIRDGMNAPVQHASPTSAEDSIMLPSALLDDQAQPRFFMRFPARFLSDPGAALLYEHETKFGGYEYPSRRFLDIHLQPGDVFIDVGAHWGIYTLTAATRWPGQVAGLAIEPAPENAAILRRNIEHGQLAGNVEVVEAAAGAAAGNATMYRDSSMGHSLYPTAAGATSPNGRLTTSVVTLDDLMASRAHLRGRRTIIKIDAEGHEAEVIQGARRFIESGVVAAIIWEKGALYDREPHKSRMLGLLEYLRGQGFAQFRFPHENLGGSLVPFVVNHERCNVFALAPGFPKTPIYDKPPGPSAPAVPAAPIPTTAAERAVFTKDLAAVRGSDGGRWADPVQLSPAWDKRAACVAERIPRGVHVLDVGAGAMALRRFLDKTVRYTPADIVAREPGCLVADLNQGQFPEGRYDYVTMLGVLEYVHDVAAVLKCARRAAPRAIFTYSLYSGEDRDARRSLGWFTDYTARELTALLAETGWQVTSLEAIENNQVILSCRDGASSGLCGFPIVPERKRVHVMGYQNAANFGDRLGYHLIPGMLPAHCDVSFGTFQPWHVPEGPYDLLIVGIGNSLFAPLLTDELQRLVETTPHSIGIFGTQYRDSLPAERLHRLIGALTCWYARSEEDIFLYGRGHQNVHHLGDWLSLLCPMGIPSLTTELVIRPNFIQSEAPLDRVIQDIQRYQRVSSARIHPLLVALHSASTVSYEEQREMGDGQVSGKFRSLLMDVFERNYPEREPFTVNRHLVSAYQARVRTNHAHLAAAIQALLGDGKWASGGGT